VAIKKLATALVIDPGGGRRWILKVIHRHQLVLRISSAPPLDTSEVLAPASQEAARRAVRMHADDLGALSLRDAQAAWIGWNPARKRLEINGFAHGRHRPLGAFEAQVLHTPGHSQGSVA